MRGANGDAFGSFEDDLLVNKQWRAKEEEMRHFWAKGKVGRDRLIKARPANQRLTNNGAVFARPV